MEKLQNLWPEFENILVTPTSILKEQAANLGARTKNIVTARVDTTPMDFTGLPQFTFVDKGFKHDFIIVAPALGNYTYRLFSAYNDFDLYPVYVSLKGNAEDVFQVGGFSGFIRSDDQEKFIQNLKKIFEEPKTIKIIQTLLSQSQ
jgi:hypothetical protein